MVKVKPAGDATPIVEQGLWNVVKEDIEDGYPSQSLCCYAGFQDPHRREFIAAAAAYTVLEIMSLNFPNQSRSYDATLRAVRFWGHDNST